MKPTQPRQPLAPCVQATWWLAWLAALWLLATHHFIVQHTVLSAWFNLRHDCRLRHATCLLSQPVCLFVIVLDKWWVQISLCPSHYFGIYRWFKMYQDLLIGYYGNIVFQPEHSISNCKCTGLKNIHENSYSFDTLTKILARMICGICRYAEMIPYFCSLTSSSRHQERWFRVTSKQAGAKDHTTRSRLSKKTAKHN